MKKIFLLLILTLSLTSCRLLENPVDSLRVEDEEDLVNDLTEEPLHTEPLDPDLIGKEILSKIIEQSKLNNSIAMEENSFIESKDSEGQVSKVKSQAKIFFVKKSESFHLESSLFSSGSRTESTNIYRDENFTYSKSNFTGDWIKTDLAASDRELGFIERGINFEPISQYLADNLQDFSLYQSEDSYIFKISAQGDLALEAFKGQNNQDSETESVDKLKISSYDSTYQVDKSSYKPISFSQNYVYSFQEGDAGYQVKTKNQVLVESFNEDLELSIPEEVKEGADLSSN